MAVEIDRGLCNEEEQSIGLKPWCLPTNPSDVTQRSLMSCPLRLALEYSFLNSLSASLSLSVSLSISLYLSLPGCVSVSLSASLYLSVSVSLSLSLSLCAKASLHYCSLMPKPLLVHVYWA